MATNTAGTNARFYETQQVHYLRKRITFADYGTTVTVGKIPAGASVIDGGVHVVTAFNSSGTDLLDVGFIGSTTDADAYATDLTMAAVGYIPFDELGATTNIQQTVDTTVTCAPAQSVADATAGVADVIVAFVVDNDN
ncbi:MAG: hypothetical protein E5X86_19850 [Mesorhizobium sp.]|uniref:hypothetical protein n=1 Tax=Mesorhizobium sp. TaxID=1871066 RepID=UPI0012246E17|nr:hypothetical protein [Mesorhizobium sp.]TIO15625.1 MAG: hypothetical protein E5X86_19850 [Mesorhizobium sp.]